MGIPHMIFPALSPKRNVPISLNGEENPNIVCLRQDLPRVIAMRMVMTVAIGIFGYMLYSRVQIAELSNQISAAKSELSEAESEYDYLNMQVQSKTSLANVEEYARNELGMKKLDNYQVEYITIKDEAPAEVESEQDDSFWGSIMRAVQDFLS